MIAKRERTEHERKEKEESDSGDLVTSHCAQP